MAKLLFFCTVLLIGFSSNAQTPREGMWLGAQLQLKFSDKWAWQHDAGYRTAGTGFLKQQILYRTGARYFVNKDLSVAAGGAVFFSRSSFDRTNTEFGREFRLWQEAFQQIDLKKLLWQNRFTAEQRFYDDTKLKPAYNAYRFRLKTIFTKPLNDKWSLQVSDEYMRQLSHGSFAFDQNRVMAYAVYNYNASMVLRGGYMWLYKNVEGSRHILNINFQKNIRLKKNVHG